MKSIESRYLETVVRFDARVVAALLAGLSVSTVAAFLASSGEVPGWEASIFHAINDLPDALLVPMWLLQLSGLIFAPLAVAAVALWKRRWPLALGLAALIPLKLVVEKQVVKAIIERERPGTSICDLDETCANFRDAPLEGLSFVSGHAIVVWAMCAMLWTHVPTRWRWTLVALAVANGVARIYLGAHNPLDIVGGAGVGLMIGVLLAVVTGPPRTDGGKS